MANWCVPHGSPAERDATLDKRKIS
jgi:hypothetical protein